MSSVSSGTNVNCGDDSTDNSRSSQQRILALSFNQDCTGLSMGTVGDYVLYTIDLENRSDEINECIVPYKTKNYLPFEEVRIIERLFTSSLTAIVTEHKPKRLKLFHFRKGSEICSYDYEKPILAVKLNRTRVAICMEDCIYLHDMESMKPIHKIGFGDSSSNVDGLCALSPNNDNPYLAYPGSGITGTIQVFDTEKLKQINLINAHDNPLVAMAFDMSGLRIATASNRGTVIRVHNVVDSKCVAEFRRGSKRVATIYSLAFSPDSMFLAASSNTETIHIFRLGGASEQPAQEVNTWMGTLSHFGSYLPLPAFDMLTQERSYAQVHLETAGTKRSIAMKITNQQLRLFVADYDGNVSIYQVNTKEGGECKQIGQCNLFSILDNTNSEQSPRSSVSLPINTPRKYPPNLIRNLSPDLSQSPPTLTNTKYQTNQSFDTAIEDQPLSSTPQTDYD